MARTRAFVLFVAVLLALSGCSAFFDFNAFSSLDKPSAPDPSRYQGLSGLTNLQTDLGSPSIVNTLKNNFALSQQILNQIENDPSYPLTGSPPWSPAQQTAAILYSSLALQSTSGDQLVNNVVATLMTSVPGNIQSILQSIIPAGVMADQSGTSFTNMVNGLLNAEAMYVKLGNSILDVNGNGKIDPGDAPPGMNMGDAAQKAAVALLMYAVDRAVIDFPVPPGTDISELWKLVNNQPNHISGVIIADPLNPLPGWLKNIFDAAGAPYPA